MCDNSSYLLGVEKKKNKPVEITEDKFNEMSSCMKASGRHR